MNDYELIVIGGGVSGLMAAGQAAGMGVKTLVLEKMDRVCLKLGITGKGRCNLTNIAEIPESVSHFSPDGRFLYSAFSAFFVDELRGFFSGLGVETIIERGGRVFPKSSRALDVVYALKRWALDSGVEIQTMSEVKGPVMDQGRISGVEVLNKRSGDQQVFSCRATIIATGGASYPLTGSTGDGYPMARSAGHSCVSVRPALVPLVTAGDIASRLNGLGLRNVGLKISFSGAPDVHAFGEMVFTPFGISGPIVLSLSRAVVDALERGEKPVASIDLKPALDAKKLDARLMRDLASHGKDPFKKMLSGLLPGALIPVCLEQTSISAHQPLHQVNAVQRKRLGAWLKGFQIKITGHRPIDEAIITAGGVDLKEINPRTMASRMVDGLFFAGEILDLDADTGGYNLQAAFSTGVLAGQMSAGYIQGL
ncbi:MAG: NAD(P)/FAD-dependent oxidoreductase [Thermodesulfobacteriota bacterium]|nr:NAD(P)/FAD-dependent oxidoreductase [Thermodesulfobacteriota bacterium]